MERIIMLMFCALTLILAITTRPNVDPAPQATALLKTVTYMYNTGCSEHQKLYERHISCKGLHNYMKELEKYY